MLAVTTMVISVFAAGLDVSFDTLDKDFGNLPTSQTTVEHTFTFVNTSSQPIQIENIAVSCGCIEADYTEEPVPPGGKGYVRGQVNLGGPGRFNVAIHVKLRGAEKTVVLKFYGRLQFPLRTVPGKIVFKSSEETLECSEDIILYYDVTGMTGEPQAPEVVCQIANVKIQPSTMDIRRGPSNEILRRYYYTISYSGPTPPDEQQHEIKFLLEGGMKSVVLPVKIGPEPPIESMPSIISFGAVSRTHDPVSRQVKVNYRKHVEKAPVWKPISDIKGIEVRLIAPTSDRFQIMLTPSFLPEGPFRHSVTVVDEANASSIEIPVSGLIRE